MNQNSQHLTHNAIRKLLTPLERGALVDVLVDLAASDDKTANYLEVRFGTRGEDEDLAILAAKKLAAEYKIRFNNRPAFVDELSNAERRF